MTSDANNVTINNITVNINNYDLGPRKPKPRKRNYLNNPDFYQSLLKYKEACNEADNIGIERPQIPRYIGECIFKIATHIGTRKNFSGYPFIEDMIMDAVETCLRYIDRFDPIKYDNPFAYFSLVAWNAFLQRIGKEKKALYIKYKNSLIAHSSGGLYESDGFSNVTLGYSSVDVEYMNSFIEEYERKMDEKKEKTKQDKLKKET